MSAGDVTTPELDASIRAFAQRNADYYAHNFGRMHRSGHWVWTFNVAAAVLGPLWAGMRGAWSFFCVATLAEIVAWTQIGRGWFAQGGSAALQRATELHEAALARALLSEQAAQQGDSATAQTFARIAHNLQQAADQTAALAQHAASTATGQLLNGIALLLFFRLVTGLLANSQYERQYCAWRADKSVPSGVRPGRSVFAALVILAIGPLCVYRFTAQDVPAALLRVPVDKRWFSASSHWFDQLFADFYRFGHGAFDAIRDGIRGLVGVLEVLLVLTPWPVVMAVIVAAAWRLAGFRLALLTAAAEIYLAVLGLWEPAMQTVALLGTAALICIVIGIPSGVWLAGSERAYAVARPVLDLMQTMPAIVYLIPAIAFFGTGSPPGVVATIIFGMPPVIRLTALGIRQVPADTREGARAFGASRWQLLTGVELPLAMPSIMAGVNQTILMCLSMVVVAALIGAQGLGSTVLEALQFAATGQGILAGVAILLCAVVIDRLAQGAFRSGNGDNRDG